MLSVRRSLPERFPPISLRPVVVSGRISVMEIVFSVYQENDGGFVAECLSHDIFTQADSWDELRSNVQDAVTGYFFDQLKPERIRLHLVRDEVLACA
jgi:predicted RNase H-like HicB family nuclease